MFGFFVECYCLIFGHDEYQADRRVNNWPIREVRCQRCRKQLRWHFLKEVTR